jgi:hypothetical protein
MVRFEKPTMPSSQPVGEPPARQPYRAPRLVIIATTSDLLEVLGPAQANYGPPGMPMIMR